MGSSSNEQLWVSDNPLIAGRMMERFSFRFDSPCAWLSMRTSIKTARRSRYVPLTPCGTKVRAFDPAPPPPDFLTNHPCLPSDHPGRSESCSGQARRDELSLSEPEFLSLLLRAQGGGSPSQIEGTQFSLCDLLLDENANTPGVPLDAVQVVSNDVAALILGIPRSFSHPENLSF